MSGNETTLKISKFNKNIVIFEQTAFVMQGDKELEFEADCNDYNSRSISRILLF
jgi:hypothetical protein